MPTAASDSLVLALRARVAERKKRVRDTYVKNLRKPFRPAAYPRAVELEYERRLVAWTQSAARTVGRLVGPHLESPEGLRAALARARDALSEDYSEAQAGPLARSMVTRGEEYNRRAMNEQWARSVGVAPFKAPEPVRADARMDARVSMQDVLKKRLADNVGLITSIPEQMLGQVQDILKRDIGAGLRVEAIQKHLKERFDVAESRARLIARDQVGKLNATLTESRNRSIGIDRYMWQTSGDERVRGNPAGLWPKGLHYDLNGKIFRYDDPPIVNDDGDTGHPGEDYQCRCNQVPQVGDALAALGI